MQYNFKTDSVIANSLKHCNKKKLLQVKKPMKLKV